MKAPIKIMEYQVRRENDGTAIGPKTRLVYENVGELVDKLKAAHVNAVRYADRLERRLDKVSKLTVKGE